MKKITAILIGFLMILCAQAQASPISNVECIAPAGAGGGWDFTCRVPAAQVMGDLDLVEGSIKVTNMSGAGGGRAFAHVVTKRKGDANVIIAASMATAARLGQNIYAGFSADDVRWLGALGADYGVIAVAKNSQYKTITDLLKAMQSNQKVRFVGGSSAGGWDHLKILILANKYGINNLKRINYVAFDNGGKAMLEIIGHRADVFTGDTSEVLSHLDAGNIRILAVLSPERVKRLGDVKTAKEQGINVIGANWRGFYAPSGISNAEYSQWVGNIVGVAQSKEWQSLRQKNGLAKFNLFGEDFENFVREQVKIVKKLSQDIGLIK